MNSTVEPNLIPHPYWYLPLPSRRTASRALDGLLRALKVEAVSSVSKHSMTNDWKGERLLKGSCPDGKVEGETS